jgi:hypothetical protein
MKKKKKKEISLNIAIFCIALSVAVFSGGAFTLKFGYKKWLDAKKKDPKFFISSVIQTGPQKDKIPFTYLCEILSLSQEKPVSLYQFSVKKAEKILEKDPCIKKAKVKKISPNALYLDLKLRKPVAKVYDLPGFAVDEEGIIFPIFSDKNLPEVCFDLPKTAKTFYGLKIKGKKWDIFERLHTLLAHYPFLQVSRIDLSRAEEKSLGKREIILTIQDVFRIDLAGKEVTLFFPKYLRMGYKNYSQQLANFLVLRDKIHQDYRKQVRRLGIDKKQITFAPKVINMRIGELAFVEK